MSEHVAIFAGQGAQYVGMGRDLLADETVAALFDRAGEVLGFDLKRLCLEGPLESLTRSDCCQPAVFVTSVASWHVCRRRYPGCAFTAMAGLSLGEWTALHLAGVLDFETTVRVLEARGRFMQEACEECPGGMVSVMGLSREQVAGICRESGAHMANINSDRQIALSGTRETIAAAGRLAAEKGARTVFLSVAGAFHSPLMSPARERLGAFLRDVPFAGPDVTVLANVTGEPHPPDGEAIKEAMLRQMTEPVRWVDCVRAAAPAVFIEFGPGKVLSGLVRRIDRQALAASVQDLATLEAAAAAAAA